MNSQIFAIYYLNDLDHFIKEKLHIKYYVRYMDDFILFSKDKNYLKYCLEKITIYLDKIHLKLNDKTEIINTKDGLNFLGYRYILKDKKIITLINNNTKKRIIRKLNKLEKDIPDNYVSVLSSYKGYIDKSNSKNF